VATAQEPAAAATAAASVDRQNAQARLRSAARRLARRPTGSEAERSLLIVGAVCVPLGLVLILLGYWGAAHASRVIQQIPYEISGGLLGLALVFGGGFAYFGYWLSRIQREQRRLADNVDHQTAVLADALGRIEALLGRTSRTANRTRPTGLVRTPSGSLVHEPGCAVVANRDDLVAVAADSPGITACKICGPDVGGSGN
jgi:hypothetical protein